MISVLDAKFRLSLTPTVSLILHAGIVLVRPVCDAASRLHMAYLSLPARGARSVSVIEPCQKWPLHVCAAMPVAG